MRRHEGICGATKERGRTGAFRTHSALLFSSLSLLLALPSPALGWCQLRGGTDVSVGGVCATEGPPLAWPTRCLSYSLNDADSRDLPLDRLRTIVAASFDNWRSLACDGSPFPLAIQEDAPRACELAQHLNDDPNIHTVTFVEDWPEIYDENVYAITSVWHRRDDGAIVDADILINENLGPYGECPVRGCVPGADGVTTVDLESVMTHEIGHFFGLAHSQVDFATLHASAPRGETEKRTVSSDDILGLCTIYPPAELSCMPDDFAPRGGLAEYCAPVEGCSVGGGTSGRWWWLIALAWLGRRRTR